MASVHSVGWGFFNTVNIQKSCIDEIKELHSEILGSARTTLDKAIRIGELLTKQREELKHGKWLPWIKQNLPFSQKTAWNYMRCFDGREKIKLVSVTNLEEAYRLLSPPPSEAEDGAPEMRSLKQGRTPAQLVDEVFGTGTFDAVTATRVHDALEIAAPIFRPKASAHVAHNSGENEWYTPKEFTEAARAAMGGIDLDPASSKQANKSVEAKKYFTKEDNGLEKKWGGRVWMNPPYAQPLIAQFSEKVVAEFGCENIDQACILVNNATETGWFQDMMASASAACFPKGRVRFLDPEGNPGAPLQGQAIIYFGPRVAEFKKHFKQFGFVL